ncbi:hypothetical protein GCM10022247_48890 [Allokutzneria multivorans]|uniref:Uncharacterized protein n=1 Tax=Allokutzneria multivorans TaxID=1142134 RepID=A0ABP7T0X0_9PSEU
MDSHIRSRCQSLTLGSAEAAPDHTTISSPTSANRRTKNINGDRKAAGASPPPVSRDRGVGNGKVAIGGRVDPGRHRRPVGPVQSACRVFWITPGGRDS